MMGIGGKVLNNSSTDEGGRLFNFQYAVFSLNRLLEPNVREIVEFCITKSVTLIRFTDDGLATFEFSSQIISKLSDPRVQVISSVPVLIENSLELFTIQEILKYSDSIYSISSGIKSDSIIKIELLQRHLDFCSNCKCVLSDAIKSTLNLGFRQIYSASILSKCVDPTFHLDSVHQFRRVSQMVKILRKKLNLAIDGERMSPRHTGSNTVAAELVHALQKNLFIKKIDILIPSSNTAEWNNSNHKTEIIRPGTNRITNYDCLFRPCQSWEPSWLNRYWKNFSIHIQWWLDFISFEIPEYAGGADGIKINLVEAERAFLNYEGTFFLSKSVSISRDQLELPRSLFEMVLPCTVNATEIRNNLDPRKKLILQVGNSFLHKGRDYSLILFREILKIDPDYRLTFIGPDPKFASSLQIEQQILSNFPEIASKINILGAVNEDELTEAYLEAMFVVCPSSMEGFGLVPFEAALHGAVPVVPQIDAWNEFIEAAFWLDLFDPKSTAVEIVRIANDDILMNQQRNAFIAWSESNKWEEIANRAIYGVIATIAYKRLQAFPKIRSQARFKRFLKRFKIMYKVHRIINK